MVSRIVCLLTLCLVCQFDAGNDNLFASGVNSDAVSTKTADSGKEPEKCTVCLQSLENQIRDYILHNYVRSMRSVKDGRSPTKVSIHPELYSVVDVNEHAGYVTAWFWLRMRWKDELLTWNTAHFGGIDQIRLAADQLWLPDIIIGNAMSRTDLQSKAETYATIRSDGVVSISLNRLVNIRASFDDDKFPFDTQQIAVDFKSWSFQAHELAMQPSHQANNLKHYVANSQWKLEAFVGEPFVKIYSQIRRGKSWQNSTKRIKRSTYFDRHSEVHYSLILSRNPTFYIFIAIIPAFCITTVCLIGLFAPLNSKGAFRELVLLGLITLLALLGILCVVFVWLHRAPAGCPLLGRFLLFEFAVAVVATVVAVFLTCIYQRVVSHGRSPPTWCCSKCITSFNPTSDAKRDWSRLTTEEEDDSGPSFSTTPQGRITIRLLKRAVEYVRLCKDLLEEQQQTQLKGKEIKAGWNNLFTCINLLILIFGTCLNTAATCLIFSPAFETRNT